MHGAKFTSNESVTVTITTAGLYVGTSFIFTAPTITSTFGNATGGSGTVTFSGLSAFNGKTPSVTPKAGDAVTGYTSGSIASGAFTSTYTTSAPTGSITPEGTIYIDGTGFTFTSTATVN